MSVKTSERFLLVDGSGERVVKMAFDEDIKKRNLLVLFKFNGELNVLVPAIEIRKELNSGVLFVYFHLLFHCHYFPYLVLVFVFKFNCSLGNRYF